MKIRKPKYDWYCEKIEHGGREIPCIGCDKTCENLIKCSPGRYISRELRKKIYERDGNKCVNCKRSDIVLTIDHIIPISKRGTNDESNLQTMCVSCNTKKGNKINKP